MDREFRVVDEDGSEAALRGVRREEWDGLGSECPRCGATEYRHFTVSGGRYETRNGAVVRRSEYWDSERRLYTECLGCGAALFKHPAFDLLYGCGDDEDGGIQF